MADEPQREMFSNPGELLRRLQERADDFEKVVVYPPNTMLTSPTGKRSLIPVFSLALYSVSGEVLWIGKNDAEDLLNNGILNRMKIKIELGSEQ